MQMPFQDFQGSFHNNQRLRSPNYNSWRSQNPPLRPPHPQWRQPQYSNEYWCETCDRGFRTSDILENHKQQHEKCKIDGCQFIAHPKVITKHIQMQHSSGLFKKIAKLQDPEEIRKWKEERKKKYPTKENVEKAAAANKEKIDRGEKMGLKHARHEKKLKTDNKLKRKPYEHQRNNMTPNNKRRKIISKSVKLPAVEDTRKPLPFGGIENLILDVDEHPVELVSGFTIEDEDDISVAGIPLQDTSGFVCNALSSLQCEYESSDDEKKRTTTTHKMQNVEMKLMKNENTTLVPLTVDSVNNNTTLLPSRVKNASDDDSGPEEINVIKEIINEPDNSKPFAKVNKKKPKDSFHKKPVVNRPKPKLPSTLLQKLLFKEIRQERNIVLQCIRHIINNNFFDKSE